MNKEIAENILKEEVEGYKEVTLSEIVAQGRWNTFYEQVFEKEEDGTFWKIGWTRGSTETQGDGYENVESRRVFPRYKTITVYE